MLAGLRDRGVDKLMKVFGEELEPGRAGVFVMAGDATADRIVARLRLPANLRQYAGSIDVIDSPAEAQKAIRESLETEAETLAAARARDRAAAVSWVRATVVTSADPTVHPGGHHAHRGTSTLNRGRHRPRPPRAPARARRLIRAHMLAALMVVAPLGLAGAVSPVMLTEQTVILAGRGGRRAALRYAAGVVLTALVAMLAILRLGHAVALPTRPHLDASLDLALGAALLVVAAVVRARGRHRPTPQPAPRHGTRGTQAAFPFGVFSMATNVTTLALLVPAAKEIATAEVSLAGRIALVLVVVTLTSIPAWVPVLSTKLAPAPAQRVLTVVDDVIARHGRTGVVAVLGVAGVFFAVRGVVRLVV